MKLYFVAALLVCAGVSSTSAFANNPEPFTYRGALTRDGAPASGVYDFEFALFGAANGGVAIDVSEVPNVAVAAGAISAPFSFAHVATEPGKQWVEVRVKQSGSAAAFETLGQRSLLSSSADGVRKIAGTAGIGQSYDVAFTPGILISSNVLLGSINVPAGSYVAFARMEVETGSEVDPGNNYRLYCNLLPDFDSGDYRVGVESSVERYLTWQGAATLESAGAIQFACLDGNGHTDTELSGKLTVVSVGAVN